MAAPLPRGSPQVEQSFFPLTDLGDKHCFKKTEQKLKHNQVLKGRDMMRGRSIRGRFTSEMHIGPSIT